MKHYLLLATLAAIAITSLHAVEVGQSGDRVSIASDSAQEQTFIKERTYEGLESYIVNHLMGTC